MSKPIIGVTPLWDAERQSVWMIPEYLDAVRSAGGIPVILPLKAGEADIQQAVSILEGVLLTGGPDVGTCPERDALESLVLDSALEADKPVFGICRGIQFINASLGGTLWQDLPTEHPSEISHRQGKPYGQATHRVSLSGPLRELMGETETAVNSRHHQAVNELASGLSAMAISFLRTGLSKPPGCPGSVLSGPSSGIPSIFLIKKPKALHSSRHSSMHVKTDRI